MITENKRKASTTNITQAFFFPLPFISVAFSSGGRRSEIRREEDGGAWELSPFSKTYFAQYSVLSATKREE